MTQRRLIEQAFPLKQVSEDSRHEKNVRHGHISTLHIWPARRPLAACRAALIAALLPDPGDEAGRKELCDKITRITHWGTENGPELDFFRREIRKAFGGRAPRVLDPFAGGGAIPLEALRLGCDVVANDYNPVAWFILKCTLEFPQRLAGKTWPLPETTDNTDCTDKEKEESVLSVQSVVESAHQPRLLTDPQTRSGDLAAHVRYWGNWVLERAREELAGYYPTVNGQPTVAYLWARTVPCPDPACGASVPLLKTLWLCKKPNKRRALRIVTTDNTDFTDKNTEKSVLSAQSVVRFEIWTPGPRDEVPEGTMQGAKSRCPCCGAPLTPDYIKACGHEGKMGAQMTAVVVNTPDGKEYRLPTPEELVAAERVQDVLPDAAAQIPYGLPTEPLPGKERHRAVGSQLPDYGFRTWADLFTQRQLLALVTFTKWTRTVRDEIIHWQYPEGWTEAIIAYLALSFDRLTSFSSTNVRWKLDAEAVVDAFSRFALQMQWDFAEPVPIGESAGAYLLCYERICTALDNLLAPSDMLPPTVINQSATDQFDTSVDVVFTDPPYYDSIPYADIADFFYVWLRRTIGDQYMEIFSPQLTPKTEELVQQHKSGEIGQQGKRAYEKGMSLAFSQSWKSLEADGRMVIVFAHKEPDAWETLINAMIQSGFTIIASWPLDTEMSNRARAMETAALASSIWMVCRKRPADAGVGRYGAVRRAMQERVTERLRYFWDIGISGPDFVWAAVGPALEAYSAYESVRRLDGTPFTVSEFLKEVRRLVADFALGQILKGHSTEGLDEWTRYYLIHRSHFGMEGAPVGEAILLSQGYGLDLNELRGPRGFLVNAGGSDLRLAKWEERTRLDLGNPHPGGGLPLVDMLHRLMWVWASGDTGKLRAYVADRGLVQNDLFWAVAQAVLEMAAAKTKERALLEALVAWGKGQSNVPSVMQPTLGGW